MIVLVCIIVVFSIVILCGLIVGAWKFKVAASHKDNYSSLNKRYPNLVMAICISSIAVNSNEIYYQIAIASEISLNHTTLYTIFRRIYHTLLPISNMAFIYLIVLRFWLIYYDLCWNSSNFNSKWIYHINPQLIDNDFWLKHRRTLGNYTLCKKIMFTMYLIVTLTSIGLTQLWLTPGYDSFVSIADTFQILFTFIPITFCIILFCKAPKFDDNLWIRYEFKICIIILCIALIAWIATAVIYESVEEDIANFLFSFVIPFPHTISFVSTYLVLSRINQVEPHLGSVTYSDLNTVSFIKPENDTKHNDDTCTGNTVEVTIRTPQSASSISAKKEIEDIFMDYTEFENFMKYLMREFAMESGLALLEFVQFKYYMQEELKVDGKMDVVWNESQFPKSWIVYESQTQTNQQPQLSNVSCEHNEVEEQINKRGSLKSLMNIVILLTDKYIAFDSILEINIAYENRKRFVARIDKWRHNDDPEINIEEIFSIFDEIILEMMLLLKPIYFRFNAGF